MEAREAREESSPRGRQSEIPDPVLDPYPQLRLAHPRYRAPPPTPGPQDWTERYNTTPVLIETFVETPRYTGAVYKASDWTHVGSTQGRGRYDTHMKRAEPRKDAWLRPLKRDWNRTLNR